MYLGKEYHHKRPCICRVLDASLMNLVNSGRENGTRLANPFLDHTQPLQVF